MLTSEELAAFRSDIEEVLTESIYIFSSDVYDSLDPDTFPAGASDGFGGVSDTALVDLSNDISNYKGYHFVEIVLGHIERRDRVGVGKEALDNYQIPVEKEIAQIRLPFDTELSTDSLLCVPKIANPDTSTLDDFYVYYIEYTQRNTLQGTLAVMVQTFKAGERSGS